MFQGILVAIGACLYVASMSHHAAVEAQPIRDILSLTNEWDPAIAVTETSIDVKNLVAKYRKSRRKLKKIVKKFKKTRVKNDGIRNLALWGAAMDQVLDLPTNDLYTDNAYEHLIDVASMLRTTKKRMRGYAEDRVLRGWPMYLDESDKHPVFEGYNSGHISMAIALAARRAAMRKDHDLALKLLTPVLENLYDGFMSFDVEKCKVNEESLVVLVPLDASKDRKKRYRSIGGEKNCLGQPEAYNHGIQVARAAIAALRAIDEIDWKNKVAWPMTEWTKKECQLRLSEFIRQNARWMRSAFYEPSPTGSDPLDKYPGSVSGKAWFQWKYRDLSTCQHYQGGVSDRLQDIVHAKPEIHFVGEFRTWAAEQPLAGQCDQDDRDIFPKSVLHRMIVTFLNRIVYSYEAPSHERFACAISGIITNSTWGDAWKQCKGARRAAVRAQAAAGWLALAYLAKDDIHAGDQALYCDVLRMVKAVLPLALPGNHDFDRRNFRGMNEKFSFELIAAKHYFYHYELALKDACAAH